MLKSDDVRKKSRERIFTGDGLCTLSEMMSNLFYMSLGLM